MLKNNWTSDFWPKYMPPTNTTAADIGLIVGNPPDDSWVNAKWADPKLATKLEVDTSTTKAIKHDIGKRDWSMLPYDSVEEIVKVLEFGATKYAKHNWKQGEGFKYSRTFNAIMRHMLAFMRGEDNDPETGISHWAHVGCNVLFILHFVLNKNKYDKCDDRG